MDKMIQIPEWQFKHIENALRLTHKINKCASKETAFDREVVKAYCFATEALENNSTSVNSLHKHVVNGSALKKDIKKAIKKNCDGTHTSYLYEWSLGTGIPELFDDICKKVDKHCR